ncbi:MAG: hypothetical protein AAGD32_02305 [Planctomycetota bacterium]
MPRLVWVTIVGVVLVGCLGILLMPALSTGPEPRRQVRCAANLRMIGLGLMLYANDNDGQFPPVLATVLATQDLRPNDFTCPGPNARTTPPTGPAMLQLGITLDYAYLGAGLTNTGDPTVPMAFEITPHTFGGESRHNIL